MLYSPQLEVILPIINSIGAPIFLVDVLPEGGFSYFAFNRMEEEDVGLTTADVNGKRPEELFGAAFATHLIANYQRCVDARSPIEIETYLDTPEGRRWAINRFTPIFDETGRFTRIMGTVIEITKQRQAEQRLKESEHKYSTFFEQSREAIVIATLEGTITEVNQAGLELFGYTREDLIGQNTTLLYADPSYREVVRQHLLTMGFVKDEEFTIRRKDGSLRAGLLTISELATDEGQQYLGIIRDITAKKSIENTLYFVAQGRHSETFFMELMHHLAQTLSIKYAFIGELCQDGSAIQTIALYDQNNLGTNITYELAQTPCENTVGKKLCYYPQNIQTLFPHDTLLVEMNAESYMGIPLWKSDRQPLGIIVLMDDKPLPNPQLAETLLQIVAVRVAHELERQQADQALKASEARYRAVVEAQTEFIVRWKPDSTRTFVNDAYSRYFDIPPEAMLGSSFFPLIAPEDREMIRQKITRITPQTPVQHDIHRVLAPNGEVRWQEWSDRGIFDETGKLIELQSVGRDVTEREQAKQALAYYSDFQSLITTLATEFINLPIHKIDDAITHALQAIGEFVGANRCSINMLAEDMSAFKRTHEWTAKGFKAFSPDSQDVPLGTIGLQWAVNNLLARGVVVISEVANLPKGFDDLKDLLASQQAQALIGITLFLHQKLIGFITLHFPDPHMPHSEDTIKLLQVVGETFVNALDRKQSEAEIHRLTAELEQRVIQRTAALAESEQKFRSISEQAMMGILIVREGKILYANQAVEGITKHAVADLLAWQPRHYIEFIHEEDRPKVLAMLQRLNEANADNLGQMEFRAYTRDQDLIWVEQYSHPLLYEGQPATLAMIVDITNRKKAEELQRQHRNFTEALLNTGMALTSTLDFETLIQHIFDNMQRVVQYDTAVILLNANNEYLEVVARRGYPSGRTYLSRLQLKDVYYLPQVLETQQPVIVPDTRFDSHFINHPAHQEFNVAYLYVPMILDGESIGILALGSQTPHFFHPSDAQYLQIFAQQAGLAVRNAQSYKEAQTLATLQERQRLARDLHDSVNQTLFSAATFAELVSRLLDKQPDKARQYAVEVEQLTRTAVAEMRTLLMELRPDALARTDLGVLLKQLCDALSGNTAVQVTLTVTDKVSLPEESQVVFYRIAQEALNNITKHAHATQVRVKLQKVGNEIELRIADDGRGFAQDHISSDHFGLKIMAERANSIGATLTINSTNGTEIVLTHRMA